VPRARLNTSYGNNDGMEKPGAVGIISAARWLRTPDSLHLFGRTNTRRVRRALFALLAELSAGHREPGLGK